MLGAQGIGATGFKRAQGNAHCAKFESNTNRFTFDLHQVFRPIELIYVGGPAKHQFLVPLQFDLKKYCNHILIGI